MTNYAIVLGIDRYATDLESLTGAVADAHDFASWLVSSGEVPAANLRLGVWPGDASPPLPELLQGCLAIGTRLDDLDLLLGDLLEAPPVGIDRFYFFFSGHGALSGNPVYAEEAICLQGFSAKAFRQALEVSSLMGVLNAIAAQERFIVIDGCRNSLFKEDIRFGSLSWTPRPAKGQRRNYVLRATGPGRKAAEVDGRGLFTRALCEGLQGAGSAKRWDPGAYSGDAGYVVRWRALAEYVFEAVVAQRPAQRSEQLIFEEGEHPANENPLLATFSEQHFENSTIAVRLVAPSTPPQGTQVFLRRNDSTDDDLSDELPSTGMVEFHVPPSAWVLWARANGWRSQPKSRAVPVYLPRVDEEIALVPEPATRGISRGARAAQPPARGDGTTPLLLGGAPLSRMKPAVRVSVRRESGDLVIDPVMEDTITLAAGVYRVRLDVAGGGWTEEPLFVTSGTNAPLELRLPDTATPALARTLIAGTKAPPADGFAEPSEIMGRLAAPSVATVAAIAVAQAVQGYPYGLVSLQIARSWAAGDDLGVEALIADERDAAELVETGTPRAHLCRMQVMNNTPISGALMPTHPDVPVLSSSLVAEPGGYWLQLRDGDRNRRAGFKLATQVLERHVTLVVRNPLPSGAVVLLQFAVLRDPANRLQIQLGLVQGEALQRARSAGRDPLADPAVRALAERDWFEPFSALLAAAALLERGDEGHEMFEKVLATLVDHDIRGPDMAVLRAAQAARAGEDDKAAAFIRDAFGMRQVPLVDSLLERLGAEAGRLGCGGETAKWTEEKLRQTIGHPLWTVRRESDMGGSSRPDTV